MHLHERAYVYLKELLLDGGLNPDEVISTDGVARALGISRAPVTDAVKRLTAEGFFVVMPQIGCRVVLPEPQEVADFYELFALNEAYVTRLAAERRSPVEARTFSRLVADLLRQARSAKPAAEHGPLLRQLNRSRHEAIHALARSPLNGRIVAALWDRSDFYIRLAFGRFMPPRAVIEVQAVIARAVVDGDGARAERETQRCLRELGAEAATRLAQRGAT
ncbi:MAG: GntR family transcriptional regulator [Gammaproteobacteria bacterium]|nr:GntR family transcriptional regulator [Gammaproteobacteria bacterium]MBI5615624.1 GntR family transcriptional regulator [Gammaproteobacteria bacterium]